MPDRMNKSPSPKQSELLRQLHRFRQRHGYAPTLEELGQILGVNKVTVYQYIRALEQKGLIRRLRHRARSLEIVAEAAPPALSEAGGPAWKLVGQFRPGGRIHFYAKPRTVETDLLVQRFRHVSLLKVSGTSAEGANGEAFRDGDYLLIEPLSNRHRRQMALVQMPDGRVEVRPLCRRDGRICIQDKSPIPIQPTDILGVIVGLLRAY